MSSKSRAAQLGGSPIGSRGSGWYFRVASIERDGRVYELLGLRPLFRAVALLFGDRLPPASGTKSMNSAASFSEGELDRMLSATRYHETVNLFSILLFVPWLPFQWLSNNPVLLAYALALFSIHVVCVLLERYKRARYETMLRAGGDTVIEPVSQLKADQTRTASSLFRIPALEWFFAPRRWETEGLYRALGISGFKALVLVLMRISGTIPQAADRTSRFLNRKGPSRLEEFETETRVAELTHYIGGLLHLPFLILFLKQHAYVPGIYLLAMHYMNVSAALLQRWHRVRISIARSRLHRGKAAT